jgi:hypothetical protein
MGKMINVYTILIGKYEGNKPLGRPRLRWKDNRLGRCGLDSSSSA